MNTEIVEVKKETNITVESNKAKSQSNKAKREAQFKKDIRKVKGRFKNHEQRGGKLKFMFRRYKEVPAEAYELVDGEIYTIPWMVIEHLNNNCWYPIHQYAQDEHGKSVYKIGEKIQRFSFVPVDFLLDETGSAKNIITVERV